MKTVHTRAGEREIGTHGNIYHGACVAGATRANGDPESDMGHLVYTIHRALGAQRAATSHMLRMYLCNVNDRILHSVPPSPHFAAVYFDKKYSTVKW